MGFLKPKPVTVQAPPPPPPSPISEDPTIKQKTQQAMDDAAAAEKKARGRASTLLTGPAGITDKGPSSRRFLLGM